MTDMMANAAFYVGLVHDLVMRGLAADPELSFTDARENFYAGARLGLEARMRWPGTDGGAAGTLLLEHLIPAARSGLAHLGVAAGDGSSTSLSTAQRPA